MTIHWIDAIILILYALGMVGIAVYTRNRTKTVEDTLHAGKKGLNGWMSAFAYGTTYFSAVIFIGYAGKFGMQYQMASVWIGIGNALLGSLLAWKIIAKRTKNMTQRLNAKTMPDFFEKRYGSKGLKLTSAVIIFIFLIPYSASVYNGLSNLFEIVFKIDAWIVMVALSIITAIYLFFGGYFATALSDFIQGIIMLIGVVLMVISFCNYDAVNWDFSKLNWFTFSSENKGIYGDTVSLISLILLTSLGVMGLPQTVHKYYSVRDKKAINQGMIVSTLFALIIGFGAYFVGGLYSKYAPTGIFDSNPDNNIPYMLKLVIKPGLLGIIAVLILSASMSTLSSVSLSGASVVAIDIYKGSIDKEASDKKVNVLLRVLCVVFIAISLLLAFLNMKFKLTAIAYLMGLSWGTLAGCFTGPFVVGLITKKVTKTACWWSIISSLVLTCVLIVLLGYGKADFNCSFGVAIKNGMTCSPLIGVICIAFSIVITLIVSRFTKPLDEKIIYESFDKKIENEII